MQYIIDHVVLFDSEKGTLRLLSEHETSQIVTLPRPARLLFTVLLDNPGIVISRNDLMEAAWASMDLTVSGHNLNTYVKVIRHSLTELPHEKVVIKTIPRSGLILLSDVKVDAVTVDENIIDSTNAEKESAITTANDIISDNAANSAIVNAHLVNSAGTSRRRLSSTVQSYFSVYILILIIIGLVGQYNWPVQTNLSFEKAPMNISKPFSIDKCDVYTTDNINESSRLQIKKTIMANKLSSECKNDKYFVFYNVLDFGDEMNETQIWCLMNASNYKINSCTTYLKEKD